MPPRTVAGGPTSERPEPPTGTVALLFTDIEGSTRLLRKDPDSYDRQLAEHRSILRAVFARNAGFEVSTEGDSFFVVFDSPLRALQAAAEGQRALTKWTHSADLRVRIGLHVGEATRSDGSYAGLEVHRAARIAAAGHGGQVLVSGALAAMIGDLLPADLGLRDLGQFRLKDFDEPAHIYQLSGAGLAAEFPALRSVRGHRTNLPSQLTSFIGRERELDDLRALAESHRLVTLIGTGGTGKTRLMLQVGSELLDRHGDGVWLVELAAISDPGLIAQEVAGAVGAPEEPGRRRLDSLTDFLRSKALLLQLDNCEHLVVGAAELVDQLLVACPNLAVMASSREALGIAGEVVFQVPSLGVPDMSSQDDHEQPPDARFERIAASEAVRLFRDRATAALPSFRLTPANAPAVAEICQRLDGIPLAIELAAARVTVLSVDEIASKLGDRFRLLTGGRRTALPRQQTLQALIDWSWDLLADRDRTLLARLSVFAGGWTLEAAAAVAWPNLEGDLAGDGGDVAADEGRVEGVGAARAEGDAKLDTLDGLSRLVDRSLVVVQHLETTRYGMLETIRQYARDRLMASGEAVALRDRHLGFFLALALEAEQALVGPDMVPWLRRLDDEIDNLRSALEWSFEADPDRALRLSLALKGYWRSRALSSEGTERLARAARLVLSLPPPDPSADRDEAILHARVLAAAAEAFASAGTAGPAVAWAAKGVALARATGDRQTLGEALGGQTMALVFSGQVIEPELRDEVADVVEQTGNWWMLAMLEGGSALGSLAAGEPAEAEARVATATDAANRTGNAFAIAFAALSHGRVSGSLGRVEEARHWFREAIGAYQEMGDQRFVCAVRSDLAHALRQAGSYDEAEALYRQTIHGWQHFGNRGAVANQLESFAFIALARDDTDRAARLLGAAEAIRDVADAPMTPYERPEYDRQVRRLRESVGAEAMTSSWAGGHALSLDEAVSLALSPLGE